jgi:hypothetical protein
MPTEGVRVKEKVRLTANKGPEKKSTPQGGAEMKGNNVDKMTNQHEALPLPNNNSHEVTLDLAAYPTVHKLLSSMPEDVRGRVFWALIADRLQMVEKGIGVSGQT